MYCVRPLSVQFEKKKLEKDIMIKRRFKLALGTRYCFSFVYCISMKQHIKKIKNTLFLKYAPKGT
jgi:hypothetical protein